MGFGVRYFRSDAATYESVRAQLDAAYGYPNAQTKTETAIPPAAKLPSDSRGRVYLVISEYYCNFILPAELLPQLIASGSVEELTATQYRSVFPSPKRP